MTAAFIQAKGLYKSFGKTQAVQNISLQVAPGEIYGLVGPDGAGKTTLIRLLCGALHLDAGEVSLVGFNLSNQIEKAREQIGYLAQRFVLYEDLTVWENLRFFAEVRGMPPGEWEPRGQEVLQFVGLDDFRSRLAGRLSGGMKQKLCLATALVNNPKVLFLDEPTTGVDPVTRQDFWQLIIRLVSRQEVAILVSTPYMDEASRCMRLGFIRQGQILLEGKPKDLRARLDGQIYELFGQPLPLLRQVAISNEAVITAQMFGGRLHLRIKKGQGDLLLPRLEAQILASGGAITNLRQIEPGLEDVFIALLENDQE